MNRTKRWMSLLLAFVMVFAFAIPTAFAADGDTNVIIHKVVMSKEQMDGFDPTKEYDPSRPIQDIGSFFGNTAKEVAGVVFEFYAEGKYTGMIPNEGVTPDFTYTTGQAAAVVIPAGTYLLVEKHSDSTYVGPDGEQLTGMKAVPQIITLPYVNEGGNIETLHLYPKNTEEKPDIVKGFEGLPAETERDYNVGDTVPYEVRTTIPVNAKYATFFWEDKMSDGLTFDRNLVITSSGEAFTAADYTIVYQNDAGFRVALTETGLAKINDKAQPITITLKYSATLNEDAVIDLPETNDIKLQYGNRPYTGNTPIPTTPSNGQITVTKTWAEGTPPTGVTVIVDLYETVSGKRVATVELNAGNNWTHTFTGLNNDLQYTAIERLISGYDSSYTVEQYGQVTVTNKKNDNPPVLNPEEPKVYTGGEKFIKVDATDANKVLPGAEFVVYRNVAGGGQEFLKLKNADQQADELAAYTAAQKAYIDAINAFNADPTSTTQAQIDALKATRDAAYEAMNMQWAWTAGQEGAFVFVSDQQGAFEVTGLKYGTYFLKEIKAPAGYALRPNDLQFVIAKGTYTDTTVIEVPNSKVTIPQTGGMGTVAFGVVGAALMGGALLGLKRKKANEDQ